MIPYGPHLTIDAKNCDPVKLNDFSLIYDILDELPGLIDMTKITKPYIFKYNPEDPEEAGITGFVIIAESHISIHTYPKKKYCFIDIFSCKDFEDHKAIDFLKEKLDISKCAVNVIKRGLDFPR